MTDIEKDMVKGMTSLLNDAIAAEKSGNPIITQEQFWVRLNDLKELEDETGFILLNSPTQTGRFINMLSNFKTPFVGEYSKTEDVVEFAKDKELVVNVNLKGAKVSIVYKDGFLSEMKTNEFELKKCIKQFTNIPLKINKDGVYVISGISCEDITYKEKLKLYVYDIIEGGNDNLFENLREAESLGFDTVPYWIMNTVNPKKLQNNIDYMYEYADEDGLSYNGVMFRYNDIEYSKSLSIIDNYRNGVIYN